MQQFKILKKKKEKKIKIIDYLKQLNKGYSGFNRSCSGFFIAGTFKSKSNVLFTQTVISGKAYDHMSSG